MALALAKLVNALQAGPRPSAPYVRQRRSRHVSAQSENACGRPQYQGGAARQGAPGGTEAKVSGPARPAAVPGEGCAHIRLARAARDTLRLPSNFFTEADTCVCTGCYNGSAILNSGKPAARYGAPLGYVGGRTQLARASCDT